MSGASREIRRLGVWEARRYGDPSYTTENEKKRKPETPYASFFILSKAFSKLAAYKAIE
jgi:hypothetical protein